MDVLLIFPGRNDLSMPELSCEAAGVVDLNRSDYWPATLHFATIYATDVFFSFEEMKMAAPGLSCQAFVRMLDQRTVRFGRVSIEFIYLTVLLISLYCGVKRNIY